MRMRKILLSMLGIAMAFTASAQHLDYFTFQTVDGTERSLPVDGLHITFEGTRLYAVAQGQKVDFDLKDMAMMFFSATATAIDRVESGIDYVAIVNGRLVVDAPKASTVQVYGVDGRLVREDSFLRGIYLVKVNGRTYKLMAK